MSIDLPFYSYLCYNTDNATEEQGGLARVRPFFVCELLEKVTHKPMEEEIKDEQEVHETPEGDSKPQDEEIDIEDLKKRAEASSQNFERAKKAEDELKKLKSEKPEEVSRDGLSNKDVIFLAKADIHEDDMDEVLDWAKFKKVPVSEAYKQLKTTLNVREEERKSAAASNTSNARRGSSHATGESLLSQAKAGKIPESDEDIQSLIKAKMGIKK